MQKSDLVTPCFIVDKEDFQNNIKNFKNAIIGYYPNGILSYSVKTNSLGHLLKLAKEEDCFAEVVSFDEYNLARSMGYSDRNIIYNGPMKSKESFVKALSGGAFVNIENYREIEWLSELKPNNDYHIGIRLNMDLNKISPEDTKDAFGSRFGFSYENGEFAKAVNQVEELGFSVQGIHIHRTSTTRSLNVYKNMCLYLNNVLEKMHIDIKYVDIGGGYYGNLSGKPEYKDYVKTIFDNLKIPQSAIVIFEPGNGLIASPISYMSTVLDTKVIGDDIICSIDGSRIDTDPLFHKTDYVKEIVKKNDNNEKETRTQIITGCTCLENDRLFVMSENSEKLLRGDRIFIHAVGAYTMTLTPNFIRLLPNVYLKDTNDNYTLIRKKWTVEEWTQGMV